jgi:hypothetical protein
MKRYLAWGLDFALVGVVIGLIVVCVSYARQTPELPPLIVPAQLTGSGPVGDVQYKHFQFTNRSTQPITLRGVSINCAFMYADNYPLTIAPGQTQALKFRLLIPHGPAESQTHNVELWYEAGGALRTLTLTAECYSNWEAKNN